MEKSIAVWVIGYEYSSLLWCALLKSLLLFTVCFLTVHATLISILIRATKKFGGSFCLTKANIKNPKPWCHGASFSAHSWELPPTWLPAVQRAAQLLGPTEQHPSVPDAPGVHIHPSPHQSCPRGSVMQLWRWRWRSMLSSSFLSSLLLSIGAVELIYATDLKLSSITVKPIIPFMPNFSHRMLHYTSNCCICCFLCILLSILFQFQLSFISSCLPLNHSPCLCLSFPFLIVLVFNILI